MVSGFEWVAIAVAFLIMLVGVTVLGVIALARSLGRNKQIQATDQPAALPVGSAATAAILAQVDELLGEGKISQADHALARSRILNVEPPSAR